MIKIGNIELPEFPLLLAPMEDVSDPPFRRLCKMHGADLMYSEFISSEGLIRDAIKSRKNWIFSIMKDLSEFRFLEVMKKQWPCLQELWKQ
jgi:tRNA-dihydrouridine synthase